jgi:hypothetical protein
VGQRQGGFFDLLEKLRQMSGTTLGDERSFEDTVELVNSMRSDDSPLRLDLVAAADVAAHGGRRVRPVILSSARSPRSAPTGPRDLAQLDAHLAANRFALAKVAAQSARASRGRRRRRRSTAPRSTCVTTSASTSCSSASTIRTEGIWPNTADWIRAAFAGVPEPEVRKILARTRPGRAGSTASTWPTSPPHRPARSPRRRRRRSRVDTPPAFGLQPSRRPIDVDELDRTLDADLAVAFRRREQQLTTGRR